jgi:DNA-binding NtrC family response regulator
VSPAGSVLVVDDEVYVRQSLCKLLANEGWHTHEAADASAAIALLGQRPVDVVVSDLRMPHGDVFALLQHLGAEQFRIPVIVITGVGTVSEAVRAMKAGAFDFLQKPVNPDELLLLTQRATDHRRLMSEVAELRDATQRLRAPRVLVGSSPAVQQLRERIAKVAPTDSPVLITGESGTGKTLVAEEIHAQSFHHNQALRRLHCAAVAEGSLAAVFTGRTSGSALAGEGGTLLLDEVGLLPARDQALLLSLLETRNGEGSAGPPGALDARRVIATSNVDLEQAVAAGSFRSDLYWRLNVFSIAVPPLREHREDIPEIVAHFLAWARGQAAGTNGGDSAESSPEALEVLGSYGWPGNVRELRNVLERAVIVAGERPLDVAVLRDILEPALATPVAADGPGDLHLRTQLDMAEKEFVQRALARANGLKKQAAYLLGIDPRNLGYYLRKHGLS